MPVDMIHHPVVIKLTNKELLLTLLYDIFFGFLFYSSFQSFHQTCCRRELFKTFIVKKNFCHTRFFSLSSCLILLFFPSFISLFFVSQRWLTEKLLKIHCLQNFHSFYCLTIFFFLLFSLFFFNCYCWELEIMNTL